MKRLLKFFLKALLIVVIIMGIIYIAPEHSRFAWMNDLINKTKPIIKPTKNDETNNQIALKIINLRDSLYCYVWNRYDSLLPPVTNEVEMQEYFKNQGSISVLDELKNEFHIIRNMNDQEFLIYFEYLSLYHLSEGEESFNAFCSYSTRGGN